MEPLEHSRWNGLKMRAISGALMAVILLGALWIGGWLFTLLVTLAALQALREWDTLTPDDARWKMGGLAYIAIPCSALIWLRDVRMADSPQAGALLVLFVMLSIWATDIGAYFAGRRIGGPKLAPAISPGKTWAGLGGGIVCAAVVGALCSFFTPYPLSPFACLDLAALLAILAQGGDLFESWLKRRAGAKDSGTLIPGHGGLLDRIDGLMFTLPLFAWLVYMSGNVL